VDPGQSPLGKHSAAMSIPLGPKLLKTRIHAIFLSTIDSSDRTCLLCPHVSPDTVLLQSIQNVGLVNPPLVSDKKDGTFGIVCGFRRIEACKMLGWREIDVRMLQEEHAPSDLLQIAIWDNRSHRTLNVVEQARGIHKLSPFIPQEEHIDVFSSLLGFPPNKKVFQKIKQIGSLPEKVQIGILEDKISMEAAVSLGKLASADALLLFQLLANLKMSQNKQKELITLISEIAAIEELKISDVLRHLDIQAIMERPNLNRNEKSATIRKKLKQRRFPSVVKAEVRFKKAVKELRLDDSIHITPPPYFEGQSYVLRLNFKSLEDLDDCCKRLDALIDNPATKSLLERND
jgi:ParB family chromosome partitioning protein